MKQATLKTLVLGILVTASIFFLGGCTSTIPLKYTPMAAVESFPLSMQGQRVVVTHFEDARGLSRNVISNVGGRTILTSDDVGKLVSKAAVDALRKAGIHADLKRNFNTEDIQASTIPEGYDAILLGRVTIFRADIKVGWSNVDCYGIVGIEYQVVSKTGNNTGRWFGPVIGKSATKVPIVMWSEISNFTDTGLQRCMENFIAHAIDSRAFTKVVGDVVKLPKPKAKPKKKIIHDDDDDVWGD